ncbi:MAG: MDR family MFS transporter [Peptococcaceae bacterium]
MENAAKDPAGSYNAKVIAGILLTGSFIAILNQTLLVTALPAIMNDLNIEAAQVQWLTTVFMLVNGIMIPITAFLIEKFSTRKLFITAISVFALGTLIAAVSPNFTVLLLGRIVQASAAGVMMPLMQTVFLFIFPIEKRGAALGMTGLVIAFAPAIGPTISGWIVDSHSWRYLFYLILPIALLDIILAVFTLKNVTKVINPKLDFLSIVLSSAGFGGILYGFSTAGTHGWGSSDVLLTLFIGILGLLTFIWRQLILKKPVLELRILKNPVFTLTTLISMIVFISMIGVETLLPLYIQSRGYSALQSGLILFPGAILMGIASPVAGSIFDKFGVRGLAFAGLLLLTGATIPFTNLGESTSLVFLTIMYAIRILGISMVMMPLTTAGLNQLQKHLLPHGTALTNTMRQVAGSIGTAMLFTIMSNTAAGTHTKIPAEAMISGMNAAFFVTAVLAFIGLFLTLFIKKAYVLSE